MISNIQALRAYAAFAVLVYHTSYPLFPGNHTDFQGVSIFFVISGFIMTHITLKDDRESRPGSFMLHRVIRIVPLYWLCTLYVVAFNIYAWIRAASELGGAAGGPPAAHAIVTSMAGIVGTDVFWSQFSLVIKSLLFIPYLNAQGNPHPLLSVGWTLNMEMHFYICFALMLNFKKTLAPGLTFLAVASMIVFAGLNSASAPVFTLHASGYPLYFCGGILVYYLWKGAERVGLVRWKAVAVPAALLGATLYICANFFPSQAGAWIQAGPVILVLSALVLHSCGWRVKSRFLMVLGAASYALYLTHTLVLELLRVLARTVAIFRFESSATGLLAAVIASLAVAVIVHLFIEMPMTGWLRRAFSSKPAHCPAADLRAVV